MKLFRQILGNIKRCLSALVLFLIGGWRLRRLFVLRDGYYCAPRSPPILFTHFVSRRKKIYIERMLPDATPDNQIGKANKLARPHKTHLPRQSKARIFIISNRHSPFFFSIPHFVVIFPIWLSEAHAQVGRANIHLRIVPVPPARSGTAVPRQEAGDHRHCHLQKKPILLSHVGEIRFIFCHWLQMFHSTKNHIDYSSLPL